MTTWSSSSAPFAESDPSTFASASYANIVASVTATQHSSSTSSAPSLTVQGLNPTVTSSGRPSVTLASDGPLTDYQVQGHNCLDEGNTLVQGCWDQLDINAWLPEWVKFSDTVSKDAK